MVDNFGPQMRCKMFKCFLNMSVVTQISVFGSRKSNWATNSKWCTLAGCVWLVGCFLDNAIHSSPLVLLDWWNGQLEVAIAAGATLYLVDCMGVHACRQEFSKWNAAEPENVPVFLFSICNYVRNKNTKVPFFWPCFCYFILQTQDWIGTIRFENFDLRLYIYNGNSWVK